MSITYLTNGGIFMKRADYISWDDYFMGIALLAAKRSKDLVHKLGHVL